MVDLLMTNYILYTNLRIRFIIIDRPLLKHSKYKIINTMIHWVPFRDIFIAFHTADNKNEFLVIIELANMIRHCSGHRVYDIFPNRSSTGI